MARFCPKCGTQASEDTRFCQKCGNGLDAPVLQAPAPVSNPVVPTAPTPSASVAAPVSSATPRPSAPSASNKGCGKAVMIVAIVLVLFVVAGIGTAAYLAYRAHQKVEELKKAAKSNDLNKIAEALGGKHVNEKEVEGMPTYPDWPSSGSGTALPGSVAGGDAGADNSSSGKSFGKVVPVRAGLTIVTAIQQSFGDYESVKQIKSVADDAVMMNYSADVPVAENPFETQQQQGPAKPPKTNSVRSERRILREDLKNAHEYAQSFGQQIPLTMPGTTALGISAAALQDLKTKGETPFTYQKSGLMGALGGLLGGLQNLPGAADGSTEDKKGAGKTGEKDPMAEMQNLTKTNCTLKRADQKTYSFPVLLNGERTQLPAVRATCSSDDEQAEFYFLDDAENPLSLTWKLGDSDRLQVIKIDYAPVPQEAKATGAGESAGAKQLAQKLQEQQKVQIYGIYFDFASAQIKPESKPTLDEIAEVMRLHPDWKLNVAGHTDNVGGDDFNLDLSKKRSEAVKAALVSQYQIAPDRLITAGYGASAPVETNATMEGRARNRRVELSKQ